MSVAELMQRASCTVDNREDVEEGDTVVFRKRITEDDVNLFADITGDDNPLHLDAEYARETRFHGRIAHGVLGMGLMSAAVRRLPGCAALLQWGETTFEKPIALGDIYEVTGTVFDGDELGEHQWLIELELTDYEDDIVSRGWVKVLLDPEPEV